MPVIEFKKTDDSSSPTSSFNMYKKISSLGVDFKKDINKDELTFAANYGLCRFGWMEGVDTVVGDVDGTRFHLPISGELIQEFGLTAEAAITTVICFCEKMKMNQGVLTKEG